MKKLILFILISISFLTISFSQTINYSDAEKVARNKIVLMGDKHSYSIIGDANIITDQYNQPLFFVFNLSPAGYIVVTSRTDLPPVIAYSFENNFTSDNSLQNPLCELIITDIESRIASIGTLHKNTLEVRKKDWENLLAGTIDSKTMFQQWPEAGTTSTGGWLETNWTQSSPYNIYCPIDPVTSQRSYVGCPATAMAQIVNYYEAINSTKFTDDDDYYHSYAGRNFWIDDDHEEYGFLSFPDINVFLASIATKYEVITPLTNDEKAALSFACGVAAHQVFTSEGSGTFGVDQALDAYMKFGFNDALLLDGSDTSMFSIMSQNIMEARPIHLAVVNEQWNSGHNVVVDGYNTDSYYHVNFGWGGSNNGWYLLPQEFPLQLTVIEGVIVDIAYPPVYTDISNFTTNNINNIKIYPNPAKDFLTIELNIFDAERITVSIIDITGRTVFNTSQNIIRVDKNKILSINLNSVSGEKLSPGIYILKAETKENTFVSKFNIQ